MDIHAILDALCVPDNDTRRAAEASYEAAKTSTPEATAGALVGAMVSPEIQSHLKGLAAVLLRRLISGTRSEWSAMSPAAQEAIKAALLQGLTIEVEEHVRRKICDALAELAAELLEEDVEGGWPGLLQALLDLVSHAGASQRQLSLEVFARIADSVASTLAPQMGVLVEVFRLRLGDEVQVRLAALKALHAFLGSLEESGLSMFQPLLPAILGAISDPAATAPESEDALKEALGYLVELVECYPRFFRPAINDYCTLMVALASAGAAIADSVRHLSVEWLVSLAEAKATMARKVVVSLPANTDPGSPQAPFARAAMKVCFAMMLDVEEEAGWETAENDASDPDDVRDEDVGAQALVRQGVGVGGGLQPAAACCD